jgi:hypothetical protein
MIHVVFSLIGEGGQRNEYFPKPYSLAQGDGRGDSNGDFIGSWHISACALQHLPNWHNE